jgi:phospholipid transport system transporter-binding protein
MMTSMAADPARFALPTELTMQGAARALLQLRQSLAQQAGPAVTLDAQSLQVLDSSAVAVLLELRRELQQQGRSLALSHPPQRLRDLMALYGVSELLPT